jgi:CheY-like chemotaxis protein
MRKKKFCIYPPQQSVLAVSNPMDFGSYASLVYITFGIDAVSAEGVTQISHSCHVWVTPPSDSRNMEGSHSVKRILVIEDELHISELITYNLTAAGYRTAPAFDGSAALAQIEDFAPHLITLDLLLPVHSGWEVLNFIRRHPRKQISSLPVIVLSALTSPQLQADLRQHNVEHCLSKPFSVAELCFLVRSLLDHPYNTILANPV